MPLVEKELLYNLIRSAIIKFYFEKLIMVNKIGKALPTIEKILVGTFILYLILKTLDIRIPYLLNFTLLGLAITFFLNAFQEQQLNEKRSKSYDFADIFVGLIIPKVLWVSTAITTLGILFYIINFGNSGYATVILTGIITLTIAGVLGLIISTVKSQEQSSILTPLIYRALPALVYGCYILYMNKERLEILQFH